MNRQEKYLVVSERNALHVNCTIMTLVWEKGNNKEWSFRCSMPTYKLFFTCFHVFLPELAMRTTINSVRTVRHGQCPVLSVSVAWNRMGEFRVLVTRQTVWCGVFYLWFDGPCFLYPSGTTARGMMITNYYIHTLLCCHILMHQSQWEQTSILQSHVAIH